MADVLDPVDEILEAYGIEGPWEPMQATGVVNRIYATAEVVLRVAGDHPEALADARTESIAAPAVYAAGVLTPWLLAFDDSGALLDRPFSLWERVEGETLGLWAPAPHSVPGVWREVGRQLAILHTRVTHCPDPKDYLDRPGRDLELGARLEALRVAGRLEGPVLREVGGLIDELWPAAITAARTCFLHNDVHEMNVMCRGDSLRALLDWGDAGWGDPTVEFAQVPLVAVPYVLAGYRELAPELLGDAPEARIVWDKVGHGLEAMEEGSCRAFPLDDLRQFLDSDGQDLG